MGGLKNVVTIQNGRNEAAILCALEDRVKSLFEDCLHDCVCISFLAELKRAVRDFVQLFLGSLLATVILRNCVWSKHFSA